MAVQLRSWKVDMLSASEQPEVVKRYPEAEVAANQVIRVLDQDAEALAVHYSPFGMIPKKNNNKWRPVGARRPQRQ